MKFKLLLFSVFLIILTTQVCAKEGNMKLLAVSESGDRMYGSVADLNLEIKSGSGRVFLDTSPTTKLDTQLSTRFARDFACSFLNLDCTEYDFFYTIKAGSTIIGGPSGSAAMAALTIAILDNKKVDESVTLTGTLNSGGIIGSVGGVEQKIEAAKKAGLQLVMIPKFYIKEEISNITNETILCENESQEDCIIDPEDLFLNISKYSEEIGISVIEVVNMREALFYLTGHNYSIDTKFKIDENYTKIMKNIALSMCNESSKFMEYVESGTGNFTDEINKSKSLIENGKKEIEEGNYYSASSFCFGANTQLRALLLRGLNLTIEKEKVYADLELFENEMKLRKTESLKDLQVDMIVKERLNEARKNLEEANDSYGVGYAAERLQSAKYWAELYKMPSEKTEINYEKLAEACSNKINEADQYYQYLMLYFPELINDIYFKIDDSKKLEKNKDYEDCILQASQAKAEASVLIGLIGVTKNDSKELAIEKLKIVEEVIAEEQERGVFPILGYSYYEYAHSLMENDLVSALLYAEYSLEISDFDFYFERIPPSQRVYINTPILGAFALGMGLGIILGFIFSKFGREV